MLSRDDRNAINGLFERLQDAERRGGPRDAEAEALIHQKMAAQPGAAYYLAQTVVVQQEALKEAERRMEELEGRSRQMAQRGPWDREPAQDDRRQGGGFNQGGGFLAGAAQTALGVAGGMMLGSMIGSIFSAGSANASEAPVDNSADTSADNGSDAGSDAGGDDFGGFDGGGFDGGFDMGGDF
ncbi:MAG: DUF2076 domain-containing protein [Hyphomicrobiales bacterium]|nr:MAG: DUF2076 domain-containing protein [Hyphomicrobiales bacterium]